MAKKDILVIFLLVIAILLLITSIYNYKRLNVLEEKYESLSEILEYRLQEIKDGFMGINSRLDAVEAKTGSNATTT